MFADEVGAVVDAAHAQDGRGGGRFAVGEGGGVPGAGEQAAAGEEAGEEGEDQGLDRLVQGRRHLGACGAMRARVAGAVPRRRFGGLALGGGLPGWGVVDC
jgi:hypothetical protein